MVFTSQIFLFVFFPACLLAYLLADRLSAVPKLGAVLRKLRLKELILIGFSLGFYMWAAFDNVFRLLLYIAGIYLLGRWIFHAKKSGTYIYIYNDSNGTESGAKRFYLSRIPLTIAVCAVVFALVYYNYSNFLIDCWNGLFGDQVGMKSLLTPLGISFITFSAVSYLVDIYRGHATPGSLIDCALYLSFFPKVISGPIVLWKDFQPQIGTAGMRLDQGSRGINRIMIGFAKKLILADTFGACLAQISVDAMDPITAFGTLVLYMLQIYYDFAGYSDIAIGLSHLLGFGIKENFNFPYRSKSITEFWRRWHISLGTWFREYLYIPLGGSRRGLHTTLRNLAVVFAVTGIWHGAGWNYVLWGLINGCFVVGERMLQKNKTYLRIPNAVKYIVTMTVVMLFWQLFRFQDLSQIGTVFSAMLGKTPAGDILYTWQYYFDARILTLAAVGILGATVFGSGKVQEMYRRVVATKAGYLLQEVVLLLLFAVAILFMVNSTYSPFIYFQY